MYYTGFADEASKDFDLQIKATKALGWKNIESRAIGDSSLAFLSDEKFDEICQKLEEADIKINCYGSGIGNWAKPINESPDSSYEEFRLAIPRMQKLGTKMVRIMSFKVTEEQRDTDWFDEVVKRMKVLAKMAEDAGVICVHENCMNWGGLSYEHTLRLMDAVQSPNFKLVFDTGNPFFSDDVRGDKPYKRQSAWEFYKAVKEHIIYVHIKDGYEDEDGKAIFTFGGDGKGDVKRIVKDLLDNGYDGGFSMEPHMAFVFHDADVKAKEEFAYNNYIEYGKRFMKLVEELKN
jgi:sugar phosphate isomerase/epimerase